MNRTFQRMKSPNRWSCLVTSFAMVLGSSVEELIEEIGHNGSEIIFPELPEPLRRRAFHIQELVDCASHRGIAVTPIEARPFGGPNEHHSFPIPLHDPVYRLENYLLYNYGVLTGLSQSGKPHAVAWTGENDKVIDPQDGNEHALSDFSIQTFWICRSIIIGLDCK